MSQRGRLMFHRSELAKSLKAYTKNHFASGVASVNCSQYPLNPPEPEPVAPVPTTEGTEVNTTQPEIPAGNTEVKEPVTDVVPEQLGSGEEEPAPTPAVGDAKKEEVTEEGGLEQVDEDLEELKVDEKDEVTDQKGNEEPTAESSETVQEGNSHTPQVTEETPETTETKVEDEPVAEPSAPAVEPRKQERVENPTYTLEITGTKYNPSNFW